MEPGTRVECVDHNGRHRGRVVEVAGLDTGYRVDWDDWERGGGYSAAFLRGHRGDTGYVDPIAIRPAS